jgi:xanthine dehydrogenase YagS FAD-binding subunit
MRNFIYLHPESLADASETLASGKKNTLAFAGGTDALGLMKEGILRPKEVVDLKRLPELSDVKIMIGEGLTIGALTTIAEIAANPAIADMYPVLSQAAGETASPQLRNVGTLGGNLCQRPRCWYYRGDFNCLKKGGPRCYAFDGRNRYHCIVGGGPCYIVHPSDMAVALLALDAEVSIFRDGEIRRMPIADFYVLPGESLAYETVLRPGDILTAVHIPDKSAAAWGGYVKFKERAVWDFAVVSVAAVVRKAGGRIESGRVAFGGVAPIPWREEELDRKLAGLEATESNLEALAGAALPGAAPLDQNGFKVTLARNLLKRLLADL